MERKSTLPKYLRHLYQTPNGYALILMVRASATVQYMIAHMNCADKKSTGAARCKRFSNLKSFK